MPAARADRYTQMRLADSCTNLIDLSLAAVFQIAADRRADGLEPLNLLQALALLLHSPCGRGLSMRLLP